MKSHVVKTYPFSGSGLCAKIRAVMFLRQTRRQKDGKTHVYWNIVERRRLDDRRVVQRALAGPV